MSKFVCFGEMLLRLSSPSSERLFQRPALDTNFVGAEANCGVLLSRLNNDVSFVSAFPTGPVGNACLQTLKTQGIDTSNIIQSDGRLAIYFFEYGAMSRASAIAYDRKNTVFCQTPSDAYDWKEILQGADWLHLCGITLAISENTIQACKDAADAARKMGVKVSFDCNFRPSLWEGREEQGVAAMKEMAAKADLIFGGDKDIRLWFGEPLKDDPADSFKSASEIFFENFPNLNYVVSTHRKVLSADANELRGFIADRETGFAQSNNFKLDNIVDRIGAGDAFAGGVLHQVGQGANLQDIIDFGVASAVVKHSILGDFNLTNEEEILRLLKPGSQDVKR